MSSSAVVQAMRLQYSSPIPGLPAESASCLLSAAEEFDEMAPWLDWRSRMFNDNWPLVFAGLASKQLRRIAKSVHARLAAAGANAVDVALSTASQRIVLLTADALEELQKQKAAQTDGRDIGSYDPESFNEHLFQLDELCRLAAEQEPGTKLGIAPGAKRPGRRGRSDDPEDAAAETPIVMLGTSDVCIIGGRNPADMSTAELRREYEALRDKLSRSLEAKRRDEDPS